VSSEWALVGGRIWAKGGHVGSPQKVTTKPCVTEKTAVHRNRAVVRRHEFGQRFMMKGKSSDDEDTDYRTSRR
jgi:hypothetical protein